MPVLLCLLCILLGIAMIAFPDIFFKIEHLFLIKDGKPSEFYIARTRLCGVFLLITGVITSFILIIHTLN